MRLPRLHKSSIAIVCILDALIVILEIPGRVTKGTLGTDQYTTFEHGWPWVYLQRETLRHYDEREVPPARHMKLVADFGVVDLDIATDLPHWSIPWLTADNWRFWERDKTRSPSHSWFSPWLFLSDIVAAFALAIAAVALWERRRRRHRNLWSYSIAELLFAMAVVAAFLGWQIHLLREFRQEDQLNDQAMGGAVWVASEEVCIAPLWVQSLVGPRLLPEYFWRSSLVSLFINGEDDANKQLADIAKFKYVTKVAVQASEDERYPFSVLRVFPHLKRLDVLFYPNLSDEDVDEIVHLKTLQRIVVDSVEDLDPAIRSRLRAALPDCTIGETYEE